MGFSNREEARVIRFALARLGRAKPIKQSPRGKKQLKRLEMRLVGCSALTELLLLRSRSQRFICCSRLLKKLVGARGFEPPASWSRTRRSTRLSHAPNSYQSSGSHRGTQVHSPKFKTSAALPPPRSVPYYDTTQPAAALPVMPSSACWTGPESTSVHPRTPRYPQSPSWN